MQPEDQFEFDADGEQRRCRRRIADGESFDGGKFLAGVLAGAAVGAAVAVMLAPQSGEDSRETLRDAGANLRDRTTESFDDAKAAVEDWIAQAKQAVDETRRRLDEAVDAGRAAASHKRAELDAQVDASLDA
jgi:gas vesicle protein